MVKEKHDFAEVKPSGRLVSPLCFHWPLPFKCTSTVILIILETTTTSFCMHKHSLSADTNNFCLGVCAAIFALVRTLTTLKEIFEWGVSHSRPRAACDSQFTCRNDNNSFVLHVVCLANKKRFWPRFKASEENVPHVASWRNNQLWLVKPEKLCLTPTKRSLLGFTAGHSLCEDGDLICVFPRRSCPCLRPLLLWRREKASVLPLEVWHHADCGYFHCLFAIWTQRPGSQINDWILHLLLLKCTMRIVSYSVLMSLLSHGWEWLSHENYL